MVSTFINSVVNSAIRLGTQAFDETDPVQLWPSDSLDTVETVIRAVYKQVLGNAHVMESERAAVAEAESQLQRRAITVREFVRYIAKSELYRARFFEPCSRNRFIELNFKHLLGRAPNSYGDIADHSNLLESKGFEAEIDSYLNSDEYHQAFGENTVPYYRGHKSPVGQKVAGFANLLNLLRGAASNDNNIPDEQQARLNQAIMANQIETITPVTRPTTEWQTPITPEVYALMHPELKASKVDPVAIQLGTQAFDETSPLELWQNDSVEAVDVVIRAVYRQVLGNAHVMESERAAVIEAESLLRNRQISVREFVRAIAKSELYRSRFFEPCSRSRFIELNFKHLLGRAPNSYNDIADHSNILETVGFEAEIDAYLDSDEYILSFGENIVPYYRGHQSPTGQQVAGFANLLKLLRGHASNDNNPVYYQSQARLTQALMAEKIATISPLSGPADVSHTPTYLQEELELTPEQLATQQTFKGYEPFRQTPPVELLPGASEEEIEVVIRAVYRQVMGNAHIMESERLVVPESQLKNGELSVREFVRQVAKSELYQSRFTDCYRYRAMELNFKHLLGRAPQTFAEMKAHSAILDTEGYGADIDSYLDSDEYQSTFGENIVPYYRGYSSAPGQTMVEFTNMLQLLKSASSSDKDLTDNRPRVTNAILPYQPIKVSKPRDAQDILAEVFKFTPSPAAPVAPTPEPQETEQDLLIAKLQQQLAELRSSASIGESVLRKGTQPKTVLSSGSALKTDEKAALIERLRGELMAAQSLATIGATRLNKWQQRNFR